MRSTAADFYRITTASGEQRDIPVADVVQIETDVLDDYESDIVRGFRPGRTWVELRDGQRIELAPGLRGLGGYADISDLIEATKPQA